MINILKPGSFALRKRERSQIYDWQKTSLHHHHQDINVGRCAAVYMQIAVTLSVAFKACKAGPCNAPLPFSWIPDATASSNPHTTHPILFSYSLSLLLLLNFTILYLFSFLPVPGDQSLASTAELLLRWDFFLVFHHVIFPPVFYAFQIKSNLPYMRIIYHYQTHRRHRVQAGLLGEHQSVCGYRSVECIHCRIALPRNMLDCHRFYRCWWSW